MDADADENLEIKTNYAVQLKVLSLLAVEKKKGEKGKKKERTNNSKRQEQNKTKEQKQNSKRTKQQKIEKQKKKKAKERKKKKEKAPHSHTDGISLTGQNKQIRS